MFYFRHLIHHTISGWTTEKVSAAILEIVSLYFSTEVSFGSSPWYGYRRTIGCCTECSYLCSNGCSSLYTADCWLGLVPGVEPGVVKIFKPDVTALVSHTVLEWQVARISNSQWVHHYPEETLSAKFMIKLSPISPPKWIFKILVLYLVLVLRKIWKSEAWQTKILICQKFSNFKKVKIG